MALLRMRNAAFVSGSAHAGPISMEISAGERLALPCSSPREAAIVALLATGIVKATSGSVLVDDYDPRVQSVHCKRAAALVPHEPLDLTGQEFARYVAYRAALWNVDRARALAHARSLLERLDGMHEAFAYPLVAALVVEPKLVVLDRPQRAYAAQIAAAVGTLATLSTHASFSAARAFAA
jgi:hypothetical protein